MKLTVFQSADGDCLLLRGADGRTILVDGGRPESYSQHVAPSVAAMRKQGNGLDVIYVSHIDADHITGVLQLLDDEVAWRVHEFQLANGNASHKKPAAPRPPEVRGIWHNAFHEQTGLNTQEIEDMLAASARVLLGASDPKLRRTGEDHANLASSVRQAIQVSRRIGDEQLRIPLNEPAAGKLMLVRDDASSFLLGGMRLSIIGPFKADLDRLRGEWNDWLEANTVSLKALGEEARRDEERLAGTGVDSIARPLAILAAELGRRDKVTAPNLASLMLYVEEGTRSILLTGDGHCADILKGLEHAGKLDNGGTIHVDVLKVQHHGSEHNTDAPFCRRVTADHYVFCGNGEHQNPDLAIVKCFIDSRIGPVDLRSTNPKANRPFKLWFNSSSQVLTQQNESANRTHMRAVEQMVEDAAAMSGGRLRFQFLQNSKVTLTV